MLQKHPFEPQNNSSFWTQCTYGHLYKIFCESSKSEHGIMDNIEDSATNQKLEYILVNFINPKKEMENFEYTKEKNSISELIENEYSKDRFPFDDNVEDDGEDRFKSTHFPIDFKHASLEEDPDNGDEAKMILEDSDNEIDEKEKPAPEDQTEEEKKDTNDEMLKYTAEIMAYSNRKIEEFISNFDHKQ